MLCGLIMAGGKGERFWPLSTDDKPKQFLNLLGEDTMIQMTVKRLEGLIPIERIFVVTAERYVGLVKEQLPNLPGENIIVEPVGRNTAPCIALSAFYINKRMGDVTIAVLPSDHLIKDEEKFRQVLNSAYEFVNKKQDAIVTLGIKPDRPETGYGYIKALYEIEKINNNSIYKVERFVEKPDKETAERYLNEGTYLWNGGMFIWKASTILKCTNQYLPQTFEVLAEIAAADENFEEVLKQKYEEVENISVDYGIMEKSNNIYVIPCDFGWDDVGSWTSLERYREKDENGNVANQNCIAKDSSGNIIMASKKVILNGIENIIVVETDDYIMISSKDRAHEIKEIKKIALK
jgi:mannose-1-phosphate guanylyltransferase